MGILTNMKVKVTANTEFQGHIKRFMTLFRDRKIKFILYSLYDGRVLNEDILSDYKIVDTSIEQGRRFIVKVEMFVETNNILGIDYICMIEKNKYIKIVDNHIKGFEYFDF